MSKRGQLERIRREFARLREQNEVERTRRMIPRGLRRKKVLREVRTTLMRLEVRSFDPDIIVQANEEGL